MNPASTILRPNSTACWYSSLSGCVRAEPKIVTLRLPAIRREQPERVAQFPQRGLDDAHVAGVLHVGQQFQRVFDDVGDFGFVVAAAFELDEFLDALFQFQVGGGLRVAFSFLDFIVGKYVTIAAFATKCKRRAFCRLTLAVKKLMLCVHLFCEQPRVRICLATERK